MEKRGDVGLREKAKQVLVSCIAKIRNGSLVSGSLIDAMETNLRAAAGEVNWRRSHFLFQYYLSNKTERTSRDPDRPSSAETDVPAGLASDPCEW
jgi:hypothetical protein